MSGCGRTRNRGRDGNQMRIKSGDRMEGNGRRIVLISVNSCLHRVRCLPGFKAGIDAERITEITKGSVISCASLSTPCSSGFHAFTPFVPWIRAFSGALPWHLRRDWNGLIRARVDAGAILLLQLDGWCAPALRTRAATLPQLHPRALLK